MVTSRVSMVCAVVLQRRDNPAPVELVNLISFSRENIPNELRKLRNIKEMGLIKGKLARVEYTDGTYWIGVF